MRISSTHKWNCHDSHERRANGGAPKRGSHFTALLEVQIVKQRCRTSCDHQGLGKQGRNENWFKFWQIPSVIHHFLLSTKPGVPVVVLIAVISLDLLKESVAWTFLSESSTEDLQVDLESTRDSIYLTIDGQECPSYISPSALFCRLGLCLA